MGSSFNKSATKTELTVAILQNVGQNNIFSFLQ